MSEPYELGVAKTARLIAARKLSVVELVETLLHRIDQLEFLKAWQYVDPDAVRANALQKKADLDAAAPRLRCSVSPWGLKISFVLREYRPPPAPRSTRIMCRPTMRRALPG